ncbi:MAG: hypothetical protein RMJ19_05125 [Gemmatales bacterium]|nr:hypothetical protein [Gemmatales bacterium]MDW8175034.1 hypothetical protein [Gemmatales bacterium]
MSANYLLKLRRKSLPLASGVLAVGLASALLLSGQETPTDARTYFPLAVGNAWRYVNSVGSESVTQVVRLEKVNQEEGYRLETSIGNRVISSEVLAVRPDGIYRLAANDVPIHPPLPVLKNPLKAGDSWSFQANVKDRVIKGSLTVQSLSEPEVTRAGKFKCVKIGGDSLQLENQKAALTTWYAPQIGPIKISIKIGDQETTLELVDFKSAQAPPDKSKPDAVKPDKTK